MPAVAGHQPLALLGRGGQGEVWRARAPDGGIVALKLLRPDLASDREVAERFRREVRLSLAVEHANVLRALAGGEDGGSLWLASELADGGSLQQLLRTREPLPPGEALDALLAVLAGLDGIHRAGLLHRDLKPANVLFAGGVAKLSDLGLARAVSREHSCYSTTGALVGTPAYISPEMVRGDAIDIRSDLYAAGCLLYACLCGRPPFRGASAVETLRLHLDLPVPDPRQEVPSLPPDLAALTMRLLAKSPDGRPADPRTALAEAALVRAALPWPGTAGAPPAPDTVSLAPRGASDGEAPTTPLPERPPVRTLPFAPGTLAPGAGTIFPATLPEGAEPAPAADGAAAVFPATLREDAAIPATLADAGGGIAVEAADGAEPGATGVLRHPAGLLFAWPGSLLRLGRNAPAADGNHVCLRALGDDAASRRISGSHLELRLDAGGLCGRDLGSTAGTRCAGRPLAGAWQPLADGSELDVAGAVRLRLRLLAGGGDDRALLVDRPGDGSGHAYLLLPASARLGLGSAGAGPGGDLTAIATDGRLWLLPAGGRLLPWGPGVRLRLVHGTAATIPPDPALFKTAERA